MANTKEYDSLKTKEGNEIYLYQAVNDDGEWNNLALNEYATEPLIS